MDYLKWSEEYLRQAKAILSVIAKKKSKLKDASPDERKQLNTEIIQYRLIYYDLTHTADHLYHRAMLIKERENAA